MVPLGAGAPREALIHQVEGELAEDRGAGMRLMGRVTARLPPDPSRAPRVFRVARLCAGGVSPAGIPHPDAPLREGLSGRGSQPSPPLPKAGTHA